MDIHKHARLTPAIQATVHQCPLRPTAMTQEKARELTDGPGADCGPPQDAGVRDRGSPPEPGRNPHTSQDVIGPETSRGEAAIPIGTRRRHGTIRRNNEGYL
jgi:hypothetical protein